MFYPKTATLKTLCSVLLSRTVLL